MKKLRDKFPRHLILQKKANFLIKNSLKIYICLKRIKKISVAESIREGLIMSMKRDKNVVLIGLGVDDPKGIFGTTKKIDKIFSKKQRVFDFPTAENTMTGIAIGSSLSGIKPVIVHQRVEFALLSLEQIINQAAKWYFMSGGKKMYL